MSEGEKFIESSVVQDALAVYGNKEVDVPATSMAVPDFTDAVIAIKEGLPMDEFEALQTLLGIGAEELAGCLSMSRSTLMRRRKSGRLDTLESDRLLRFARLYHQAVVVFGDEESARNWLRRPARALGGATPLSFAETELGSREVEQLLGRIDYGVFS